VQPSPRPKRRPRNAKRDRELAAARAPSFMLAERFEIAVGRSSRRRFSGVGRTGKFRRHLTKTSAATQQLLTVVGGFGETSSNVQSVRLGKYIVPDYGRFQAACEGQIGGNRVQKKVSDDSQRRALLVARCPVRPPRGMRTAMDRVVAPAAATGRRDRSRGSGGGLILSFRPPDLEIARKATVGLQTPAQLPRSPGHNLTGGSLDLEYLKWYEINGGVQQAHARGEAPEIPPVGIPGDLDLTCSPWARPG